MRADADALVLGVNYGQSLIICKSANVLTLHDCKQVIYVYTKCKIREYDNYSQSHPYLGRRFSNHFLQFIHSF